jgi:hypothetical protein
MLDVMIFVGLIMTGFFSLVSLGVLFRETILPGNDIYWLAYSFVVFGILIGLALAAIDRHNKKHNGKFK